MGQRIIAVVAGCALVTAAAVLPAQAATRQVEIISAIGEVYECGAVTLDVVSGAYRKAETVQVLDGGVLHITGTITIAENVVLTSRSNGAHYSLKPLSGKGGATTFDLYASQGNPTGTFDTHWQFKGGPGVPTLGVLHSLTTLHADGTQSVVNTGSCASVTSP